MRPIVSAFSFVEFLDGRRDGTLAAFAVAMCANHLHCRLQPNWWPAMKPTKSQSKKSRPRVQRELVIAFEIDGGCLHCGELHLLVAHDYGDTSEITCPTCGPLGPFAHVVGQA